MGLSWKDYSSRAQQLSFNNLQCRRIRFYEIQEYDKVVLMLLDPQLSNVLYLSKKNGRRCFDPAAHNKKVILFGWNIYNYHHNILIRYQTQNWT